MFLFPVIELSYGEVGEGGLSKVFYLFFLLFFLLFLFFLFFSNIVHDHNHVLHNRLPPLKMTGHDLRRPTWDRSQLTNDVNSLNRKIFIHRLISNNYLYSKL